LTNSYLRLGELFGIDFRSNPDQPRFEVAGQLQYAALHPDLNECLGRADTNRAEIKARQIDVEIEDRQYLVDRSELRPHVQVFSGYEVYNERDPLVGQEFNHGYLVGVNATWHLFDGFATKGRMQATRARLWQSSRHAQLRRQPIEEESRKTGARYGGAAGRTYETMKGCAQVDRAVPCSMLIRRGQKPPHFSIARGAADPPRSARNLA